MAVLGAHHCTGFSLGTLRVCELLVEWLLLWDRGSEARSRSYSSRALEAQT